MKNNDDSGFTLIEVMIAIAIFSVGLFALSMMQAHFARGLSSSRHIVHASDIAMSHIENFDSIDKKGHPWLDEDKQDNNDIINLDNAFKNDVINEFISDLNDYKINYTIEWTPDLSDDGAKFYIPIIVSWTIDNNTHSLTFNYTKNF